VNRQNYKTEHRPRRTALMTDAADEQISAAVAERTGWKTGQPVSIINDMPTAKYSKQIQK